MEGMDIQAIVRQAVEEYANAEKTKSEPAYKAELTEERKRREQLERRMNELVAENERSREGRGGGGAQLGGTGGTATAGTTKIDLAFKAVQDGIVRT